MSVYFSAIAMEKLILAQYASYPGNFNEVTEQVLSKIPPGDSKMTFSSDNYLFHYIAESKIIYFCITDIQFQSSKAFSFLNKVKFRFLDSLGRMQLAMVPYALLTRFNDGEFYGILESEMARCNNKIIKPRNMDKARAGVDELKGIMVECLNKMVVRRERLESLAERASGLETSAMIFKRCAIQTRRKYWWKNKKIYVFVVVALLFVAYGTGTLACGGPLWPKCV